MAYNLQIKLLFFPLNCNAQVLQSSETDKVGTSECNQIQQVFKDRKMWESFYHCQP